MFSRLFLSNTATFYESHSRQITITDKSPELFTIILDYLRGYTIFPLNESSIPPKWLPLHKTYDNLRRDASYYGLLRLENECNTWLKKQLNPLDKQAVFKLGFSPFTYVTSLLGDMMLECHISDVTLLRRRFLKCGAKNLTYGPMPWKTIFEQIKNPMDRDGVLQSDGSSIIDVPVVFLKPPRTTDEHLVTDDDDRKVEFAKIHVSKSITTLIQDGIRPAGMSNYITLRFHATQVTTNIAFYDFNEATGTFVFSDKIQSEGYSTLRLYGEGNIPPGKGLSISLLGNDKAVLEVDSWPLEWRKIWEWSRLTKQLLSSLLDPLEYIKIKEKLSSTPFRLCEQYFSGKIDPETKSPIVLRPHLDVADVLCSSLYSARLFLHFREVLMDRIFCPS
jgi:hypothetical protein